uniref:Uncharacterized protein n=1 Tax=Knipowitschia caucasica TaxID=637954 RepID=A0AAV2MRT7_KNICA
MAGEQEKPTLKSAMKAIRDSHNELSAKIDRNRTDLQQSLAKIEQAQTTLFEQVQEMETRVGANEDNMVDAVTRITTMENEIKLLKTRGPDKTHHTVAKFLNYRQREMVLRLAREKHPLLLDDNRISFYPDYSAETQRNMLAYNEVKKKLRDKNIEYASRYPAKLRVRHEGAFKLFSSPAEVENFLRTLED